MKTADPSVIEMTEEAFGEWQGRVKQVLSSSDCAILDALVQAYLFVRKALSATRVSMVRLKRLFGISGTEKSRNLFPDADRAGQEAADSDKEKSSQRGKDDQQDTGDPDESTSDEKDQRKKKSPRKGHGRIGADDYTGAERVQIPLRSFSKGMPCPEEGCDGRVNFKKHGKVLRITGQAPLKATVYEPEGWRCSLCGKFFWAPLPVEAKGDKYDESAVAMVAILHFANGFAFHRLQEFQKSLGVPLPASNQSTLLTKAYQDLLPLRKELIRCAAQCDVIHNDDTTMRVVELLALIKQESAQAESSSKKKKRTGIHTTGIAALTADHRIALFFTSRKHAGENLADVLVHRDPNLPRPIHMSDGIGHNAPKDAKVDSAKCLTHGRRQFVDIVTSFPEQCRVVVDILGEVYHVDAIAKKRELSPLNRLYLHQEKSTPLMEKLRRWMTDQLLEDEAQPNSGLGQALQYMLRRWEQLTLFLRKAGAPIDNNIVERVLKKAIRHRKNSLFYRTEKGAKVGDFFMSLIETCVLNEVNPFEYLVAVLRNLKRVRTTPADWMPWNYRATLGEAENTTITKAESGLKVSPKPACGPPPSPWSAEVEKSRPGARDTAVPDVSRDSDLTHYTGDVARSFVPT